jgi:predicted component of type VI protein secretion system
LRASGIDLRDLGIETSAMHSRSPAELKAERSAERAGEPFLVVGAAVRSLPEEGRLTLGREPACDLCFDDHEVSRLHCELEHVSGQWVLGDNGLSRNGTFLNGERLLGARALRDGDTIRIGSTVITYRAPGERTDRETRPAAESQLAESLTPTQRGVLVALCRPYRDGSPFAIPASNLQIADEVALSVPRVKAHLHDLYERLGVEDLPHNAKRAKLVEVAFQTGAVSVREL